MNADPSDNQIDEATVSQSRTDALVVAAKGTLGAIPIIGSIVAEVVGAIIPNQRMDRIARLLCALSERVANLDRSILEQRLSTPLGVDLLEDAFQQAARAVSDERIEYVANILKAGLTEDEAKIADRKFLMWLLGQLSDAEVILLAWYAKLPHHDQAFEEKHWPIIHPRAAHFGSSQDEVDDETVHQSRKAHLAALDLIHPRFRPVRRGEFPEFDDRTGMMKASGFDVARLGRLLLRTILPDTD